MSIILSIQARRVDSAAREAMTTGFNLTHEQATELGDEAMDWIRDRLGLTVTETDRCVECRPAT